MEQTIEKINGQNEKTIVEVGLNLMGHINHVFEKHGQELDKGLHEAYSMLQKANIVSSKIKLGVPLLNLLGMNLETGVDLVGLMKWLRDRF